VSVLAESSTRKELPVPVLVTRKAVPVEASTANPVKVPTEVIVVAAAGSRALSSVPEVKSVALVVTVPAAPVGPVTP
jgi:hypothetical protein